LMAIGSSAPELFISIIALLKGGGHEIIGISTIIGSSLFNLLVIIGIVAFVKKAKLVKQPVIRDMIFYALGVIVLIAVIINGSIGLVEALVLLALYLVYVYSVVKWRKWFPYQDNGKGEEEEKIGMTGMNKVLSHVFPNKKRYVLTFILSILWIALLSWGLVESAIMIAYRLNISEMIVALIIVAIGTSIPDMMGSIIAAKRGNVDMAVSNAIGSNVFDIFFGLGLPYTICLMLGGKIAVDSNNILMVAIYLIGTIIITLCLLKFRKWVLDKKTGIIMIGLYVICLILLLINQ